MRQCILIWCKLIAYSLRILTDFESRYSINEIEMLAVVCSIEHITKYVYGTKLGAVLDLKTLQTKRLGSQTKERKHSRAD